MSLKFSPFINEQLYRRLVYGEVRSNRCHLKFSQVSGLAAVGHGGDTSPKIPLAGPWLRPKMDMYTSLCCQPVTIKGSVLHILMQ